MPSADVTLAILGMGLATYACRAGGFMLMRFVPQNERTRAWLDAIPVAVLAAILGPSALRGGLPELAGLASAFLLMRIGANDFLAVLGSVAVVAILRAI